MPSEKESDERLKSKIISKKPLNLHKPVGGTMLSKNSKPIYKYTISKINEKKAKKNILYKNKKAYSFCLDRAKINIFIQSWNCIVRYAL